jgi:HSP20 family protein
MVTITPFNSVLDRMATLSRVMDHAFTPSTDGLGAGSVSPMWIPSLDAYETQHAYVVQLDLPGVSPDNVEVNFEQNTLTVRGNRSRTVQSSETGGELRVFLAEREWGTFARSLRFPQHVEGDKIEATFHDGVLTITIPKAEAAKPRKISINSSV